MRAFKLYYIGYSGGYYDADNVCVLCVEAVKIILKEKFPPDKIKLTLRKTPAKGFKVATLLERVDGEYPTIRVSGFKELQVIDSDDPRYGEVPITFELLSILEDAMRLDPDDDFYWKVVEAR